LARTFPKRLRFWLTRKGQFVFKVATDATKLEIKKAVESLFSVKVERVTTLNVLGKSKRTARGLGKRNDWKKAVISLQPGQDLDFSSSAE
jgi:large subunit ribosomal protein L23